MGHRDNRVWQASEGREKKIDMKSVQEENHYLDREVTTW